MVTPKMYEKLARLAVRKGVNVQKDQPLVVRASVRDYAFVRLVVKEAYEAGAKSVSVNWADQEISKMGFTYESEETLAEIPDWIHEQTKSRQEAGSCFLSIISDKPGAMADVDPKKLGAIRYHNLTDRVVFLQRETVRRLAARGSCVFVGRCADHILRHADVKTLNVFIYAPSDVRLKTVMREHNLGKTEAELLITKSDEDLHARYKQVTGTYRGDRHNRHMLIDSSLLGAERTADLIERLAFAHFGIAGAEDVDTSTVETAKAAASLSAAPDLPPVTA